MRPVLFKKNWKASVLLWGHLHPYFELLVTSPSGFKARVYPLACMLNHRRVTSCATPADLFGGQNYSRAFLMHVFVHSCTSIRGTPMRPVLDFELMYSHIEVYIVPRSGGSRGTLGMHPFGPTSTIFIQFSAKMLPNDKLAYPLWEFLAPTPPRLFFQIE